MMQPNADRTGPWQRACGASLAELVLVLLLVAVLAAVALPRLNTEALQVLPVAEQMAAEIRYTQSLAMSRSESHAFRIDGDTFFITSTSGSQIALSDGQSAGSLRGLSVSGPVAISFAPRFGRPDTGGNIVVSGSGGSVTISVDGETGYVQIIE